MSSARPNLESQALSKMTTSPSKRLRSSPVKNPWKNPFGETDSPPPPGPKGLPPKPTGSSLPPAPPRAGESSRAGHSMTREPSFGSSRNDYRVRERSRYSPSPEKDRYYDGQTRDYGASSHQGLDYRSQPSRPRSHRDWDREDERGYDDRYDDRHDDRYRGDQRREERGYYVDRENRDDWWPRDSTYDRHDVYDDRARYQRRSPPADSGRSLTRPQRDDTSRNGAPDRYVPGNSYRYRSRSRSRSRSPRGRPKTPSGLPPDDHEEGELTEEEGPLKGEAPARHSVSPARQNPYAPRPGAGSDRSGGKRLVMKDRPSAQHYPPGPPLRGRPETPPPPPGGLPPPPPDDAQPPSPPPPRDAAGEPSNPYKPRNGSAHPPKSHEDPAHPPPAPNRNHLNPTTRASTPQPLARTDSIPRGPVCPRKFARPSLQDEQDAYGKAFEGTSTLAAYDIGKKLGEGTFGVVTKGTAKVGGAQVALKKLLIHNPRDGVSVTTIREIKILKALKHKNVVPLVDMVVEPKPGEKTNRQDIFMVFPFMDHDLCGLLGNSNFKLGHGLAKLFTKQLLEGMAYIHANGIVHRDIKTANILVNQKGEIMIADFGLARAWSNTLPRHLANEYTNMVVTRWYRAPELLLGDTRYGPAVDMWSVGCVLGEMYHKEPIMPGGPNDEDQMRLIAERLGPISNDTLPQWDDLRRYPGFPGLENHKWDKEKLATPLYASARQWGMDTGGIDLLKQLLRLDPAKRLTAEDALDHAWLWTGVQIAATEKTDLGVESSHEMTTRKDHAPVPAYQQQLNDQNRQSLQQHASHRAYMPQQQPPMQGRPGWSGGPVKPHHQHVRAQPYPPSQLRNNGYDAGMQGAAGAAGQFVPMPGLPPHMPPYPFGNGLPNPMAGGQMGVNGGGGVNGQGHGWNGPGLGPGGGGGGGYGQQGNGPSWNGPTNGSNGNANVPFRQNIPPPSHHPPPPSRAPPTGPSAGRAPLPTFKLAGQSARRSEPAGPYGGGQSRDLPSHDPWGHDEKRRRTQQHAVGDKRGLPPLPDEREHKKPRGELLRYDN